MSDKETTGGAPPSEEKPGTQPDKSRRQLRILGASAAGAAALILILALWLSRTPALAIRNPSPAKLTPADCSLFMHMPDLRRNIGYLTTKKPMQEFAKSGAPEQFMMNVLHMKKRGKASGAMAKQLINMTARDMSVTSCATGALDKKTGKRAGELLVVSKLGFMDRILYRLGKGRMGKPVKKGRFAIYTTKRGGRTFHVTVGGGYLIAGTQPALVDRALDLGMARDKNSIASKKFYEKASARDKKSRDRLIMEWYAPQGAFESSLTHAKMDYGRITTGGGGVTLNFISRAHSKKTKSRASAANPARLLPASVSLYTVTHSFARIWQDLLLGKAMEPDEAETFMQELYGFGLEDLSKYFEGNVAVAMDGVFKAEDATPVPSLIFVYKVRNPEQAVNKVHEILRRSIREDFEDQKLLRKKHEYVVFKHAYDDKAVIAPSYALIGDYVFFTLTQTQMERIIDTAAGDRPNLAGTAVYKKHYSDKAAEQDAFLLINGPGLAGHATNYFTWFGDISSPELASALHQIMIPAAGMLKRSAGGAGHMVYKDDLLYGTIKFFNAAEKDKR